MIVGILPSKSQWKRWTLPSKASYLAAPIAIIGILLLLLPDRSTNQFADSYVVGDVVWGDKIVYLPQGIPPQEVRHEDGEKRIKAARIIINRLIEDFAVEVESITEEYRKQNERIATDFSSRGVLRSGMHITAQMDYAGCTRDRIEKLLATLHRNIEDILFESFGVATLEENDNFADEVSRLARERERVRSAYRSIENTVKSWDKRCIGNTVLTKDFRL